jgi:DinB superfamily/Pentapeptide repeats (8 copies)
MDDFVGKNLRGARFVGCDLSGVVMRGVVVEGADIEAPWLVEAGSFKLNGVDVVAFVDTELDRRFPGRGLRQAKTPEGLREAWTALEQTWAATLARAAAMPAGSVDESVAGEWSFAQTLRHLVLATDMWLGKGILRLEQPFHPLGLADHSMAEEGWDMSVFASGTASYDDVLAARAERVAMVRDFLAATTTEQLAEPRPSPHAPDYSETVLSCLHTILEEEWEHHRYAVRDLDTIETTS